MPSAWYGVNFSSTGAWAGAGGTNKAHAAKNAASRTNRTRVMSFPGLLFRGLDVPRRPGHEGVDVRCGRVIAGVHPPGEVAVDDGSVDGRELGRAEVFLTK